MICKDCKGMVVMSAFSHGICEGCGTSISSPHTPCYKLCESCSSSQNKCEQCGKPLDIIKIKVPPVSQWTLTDLRRCCKKSKVKGYTKMNREQLINEVQKIIKSIQDERSNTDE